VDLEPEIPARLADVIEKHRLGDVVHTAFGLDQADRASLTSFVDAHIPPEGLDLVIDDASHLLGPTRVSFEVLFPRLRPGGLYVLEDWITDWTIATALAPRYPDPQVLRAHFDNVRRVWHVINQGAEGIPEEVLVAINETSARGYEADPDASPERILEYIAAAVDSIDLTPAKDVFAAVDLDPRTLSDFAIDLVMIRATQRNVIDEVCIDHDWLTARRGNAPLPRDGFRIKDAWPDVFGYLS
jgi:hypothetical protein